MTRQELKKLYAAGVRGIILSQEEINELGEGSNVVHLDGEPEHGTVGQVCGVKIIREEQNNGL
jgi:hypothetical protein